MVNKPLFNILIWMKSTQEKVFLIRKDFHDVPKRQLQIWDFRIMVAAASWGDLIEHFYDFW